MDKVYTTPRGLSRRIKKIPLRVMARAGGWRGVIKQDTLNDEPHAPETHDKVFYSPRASTIFPPPVPHYEGGAGGTGGVIPAKSPVGFFFKAPT